MTVRSYGDQLCIKIWHTNNRNGTSELQTTQLESDKAVAHFYDVHHGIEGVVGHYEYVARSDVAPPTQGDVPTEISL